ncbi:MAG: riboflavin synthase [Bacteroidota bacterium]
MFTGIIEHVGRVAKAEPLGDGRRFTIEAEFAGALKPDESVAVNGACLTVVGQTETTFDVEVIEETLAKTSLGLIEAGSRVNLERAMKAGGRLDGHFVQGHVDTTGVVEHVETLETSWLVRIRFDAERRPYLIPVGSITVDGVSLTVARLEEETFTVALIPHTWTHTIAPEWTPGRPVNLEFDMIGKYVVGWLQHSGQSLPQN